MVKALFRGSLRQLRASSLILLGTGLNLNFSIFNLQISIIKAVLILDVYGEC
jgi:hypothetical protein